MPEYSDNFPQLRSILSQITTVSTSLALCQTPEALSKLVQLNAALSELTQVLAPSIMGEALFKRTKTILASLETVMGQVIAGNTVPYTVARLHHICQTLAESLTDNTAYVATIVDNCVATILDALAECGDYSPQTEIEQSYLQTYKKLLKTASLCIAKSKTVLNNSNCDGIHANVTKVARFVDDMVGDIDDDFVPDPHEYMVLVKRECQELLIVIRSVSQDNNVWVNLCSGKLETLNLN